MGRSQQKQYDQLAGQVQPFETGLMGPSMGGFNRGMNNWDSRAQSMFQPDANSQSNAILNGGMDRYYNALGAMSDPSGYQKALAGFGAGVDNFGRAAQGAFDTASGMGDTAGYRRALDTNEQNLNAFDQRANDRYKNAGYSDETKRAINTATGAGISGAYGGAETALKNRSAITGNSAGLGASLGSLARQKGQDINTGFAGNQQKFADTEWQGQGQALGEMMQGSQARQARAGLEQGTAGLQQGAAGLLGQIPGMQGQRAGIEQNTMGLYSPMFNASLNRLGQQQNAVTGLQYGPQMNAQMLDMSLGNLGGILGQRSTQAMNPGFMSKLATSAAGGISGAATARVLR